MVVKSGLKGIVGFSYILDVTPLCTVNPVDDVAGSTGQVVSDGVGVVGPDT